MKKIAIFPLVLVLMTMVSCQTPNSAIPLGTVSEVEEEAEKQRILALRRLLSERQRVYDVAYDIMRDNAEHCPTTAFKGGFTVWNASEVTRSFGEEYAQITSVYYGLDETIQIQDVTKGSAAAKAGIMAKDRVIAINGTKLPLGPKGMTLFSSEFVKTEGLEVELTILRSGEELTKTIVRDEICDYGVIYIPVTEWGHAMSAEQVNAYADSKNIAITRGMLRFVESDEELALVIAHEVAHNAMGHIDKAKANAALAAAPALLLELLVTSYGTPTDGTLTNSAYIAGARAYSLDFEREADYIGMYFLARSGYDTSNVASFWRRMAAENDYRAIAESASHPTSPERFLAIENTHDEIVAKIANGEELVHNVKEDGTTEAKSE